MAELEQQGIFAAHRHHTGAGQPVYPAEDYHQDYFARNAGQPYCQAVIQPKQLKLRRQLPTG
jgi:peptide-methionine (S)-S-oxide reductase